MLPKHSTLLIVINFLSFFTIICIADRVDNVVWFSNVLSFVGHNITFMWNTTNNLPIKSAIFGISHEGLADPQFINVNALTRRVHYNPTIGKAYTGRVDFVGNLTSGWAWFRIKNLQLNDTNEYLARITIDVDAVKSYPVRLSVRRPKENKGENDYHDHLTATVSGITTNGKSPLNESGVPLGTTSSSPVKAKSINLKYIFISAIALLMLVLISVCGWYLKRKRSNQGKQHGYETAKEDISPKTLLNKDTKEYKLLENGELGKITAC